MDVSGMSEQNWTSQLPAQESSATVLTVEQDFEPEPFGEQVAFGDPYWYRPKNVSPFYNSSHHQFRAGVREWVENEIMPYCHQWDEAKGIPVKELLKKSAESGWLPSILGMPWPQEYAKNPFGHFDYFHELILHDELARCGSGGVLWGLSGGLAIGLPPVLKFGSKALKDRIIPPVLAGDKIICLAITEPYAGSDVANLRCTAEKDPSGRFYTVNGEKKWITNGVFADYFTVAVRTGGQGMGGISLLLVERDFGGVDTKSMQCMGVWSSGTTYITFTDVKVPVENLIGEENMGFQYIMLNFNHERWMLAAQASRFARVCLEESMKYAAKRRTFGKKLMDHPVIRWKLAEMARLCESTHAHLEQVTNQMCSMGPQEAMIRLGGDTALLKVQATKTFEFCAREAAQIFGGASYVRGGQGEKIERLYREVRAYAIPGGSEEIMMDLAIRQSVKTSKM